MYKIILVINVTSAYLDISIWNDSKLQETQRKMSWDTEFLNIADTSSSLIGQVSLKTEKNAHNSSAGIRMHVYDLK